MHVAVTGAQAHLIVLPTDAVSIQHKKYVSTNAVGTG